MDNLTGKGHRAWAVVGVVLMLTQTTAWPRGRTGHRVSSMLAERRLTPAAVAAIRSLLELVESPADASTWADEQREVARSGPWHYVNVPLSEPRYDSWFCSPQGCVVSKVEEFQRVLSDPQTSRQEELQALRFLIHFLQDLHQPLHIGDTGSRVEATLSRCASSTWGQTFIGCGIP